MKFLCDQCKAKYQIADEKAAGKTVRMKCRKCGHLIEVRAAVTETSSAGPAPTPAPAHAATSPVARSPQKPAPPRGSPLATSLAAAKPAKPPGKPPERPGSALAGAFKSSVQREREEEVSAPFDMADLSPSDEWYVAINGVPVGPIRVAEVRRKAALGAVTEESLCWQEGLDEWRPVRSFPELALIVREAAASGRSSLPPSQDRSSSLPAHRPSNRPAAPAVAPRQPPARPAVAATSSAPMAARSNVVPITSRLATAEKIVEEPDDRTRPQTGPLQPLPEPAVVADPFANPPAPAPGRPPAQGTQQLGVMSESVAAAIAAPPLAVAPPREQKSPPWMAIAMVAAACAFGVTAGVAVFFRKDAPAAPVAQGTVPAAPTATVPGAPIAPTPTATATDTTAPEATAAASAPKGPVASVGHGGPAPSATATAAAHGPLDLQGLGSGGPRPTDDPGGGGGSGGPAPGSGITSGQVQQVIGLHQPGVKRACWERNPTTKAAVNVSVSLTVNGDGTTSNVSATSDEPSVAKCVENDVRTWHFPAMGAAQPTAFSFHFIRQ